MWLSWVFDGLLAVTLFGLAAAALMTSDLFKGVVLFVAFGLLVALAWVRLDAIDVAMAEAAIGAGLTGALFLSTLGHLEVRRRSSAIHERNQNSDSV